MGRHDLERGFLVILPSSADGNKQPAEKEEAHKAPPASLRSKDKTLSSAKKTDPKQSIAVAPKSIGASVGDATKTEDGLVDTTHPSENVGSGLDHRQDDPSTLPKAPMAEAKNVSENADQSAQRCEGAGTNYADSSGSSIERQNQTTRLRDTQVS